MSFNAAKLFARFARRTTATKIHTNKQKRGYKRRAPFQPRFARKILPPLPFFYSLFSPFFRGLISKPPRVREKGNSIFVKISSILYYHLLNREQGRERGRRKRKRSKFFFSFFWGLDDEGSFSSHFSILFLSSLTHRSPCLQRSSSSPTALLPPLPQSPRPSRSPGRSRPRTRRGRWESTPRWASTRGKSSAAVTPSAPTSSRARPRRRCGGWCSRSSTTCWSR